LGGGGSEENSPYLFPPPPFGRGRSKEGEGVITIKPLPNWLAITTQLKNKQI